ncbi:hypothetical protein DFH07DRAFT_773231 [Mycena maculata]|uniref:Uncharacterized protein n=1 Tax=Mycena maculata TaxID=230809 RepID=A0AAD7NDB6_9AGAR|nr:hypothetical protein DFH07DRAFT_773231 [Mycena maculata]
MQITSRFNALVCIIAATGAVAYPTQNAGVVREQVQAEKRGNDAAPFIIGELTSPEKRGNDVEPFIVGELTSEDFFWVSGGFYSTAQGESHFLIELRDMLILKPSTWRFRVYPLIHYPQLHFMSGTRSARYTPLSDADGNDLTGEPNEHDPGRPPSQRKHLCFYIAIILLNLCLVGFSLHVDRELGKNLVHDVMNLPTPDAYIGLPVIEGDLTHPGVGTAI